MYAVTIDKISLLLHLVPRCLRQAREFLIVPDRFHRLCTATIAFVILVLVSCFVAFAYAEKYRLTNNFFYGKLQFSFVDGGYPELFGYGLEIVACLLFATFAWVFAKKQWYAWAAILLVTFLDDAFRSHESIGQSFTAWFGVSPVQGDLIGFAITGLVSAVLWCAGIVKVKSEDDLSAYFVFTAYYAMMILFGVGVDAIHGALGENMSETLFTLFEDGGELVTAAAICLSVLGMWIGQKHSQAKNLEKHVTLQQNLHGANTTQKTF